MRFLEPFPSCQKLVLQTEDACSLLLLLLFTTAPPCHLPPLLTFFFFYTQFSLCNFRYLNELVLVYHTSNWAAVQTARFCGLISEYIPLCWPGDELEHLRPNVYCNVARQLNITVASESIMSDAFLAVAADIFSTGKSKLNTWKWGKWRKLAHMFSSHTHPYSDSEISHFSHVSSYFCFWKSWLSPWLFFSQEQPTFSSLNKLNEQKLHFHAVHFIRNCF